MARRTRRSGMNPAARLPELLVSVGCTVMVFSGFWLWYLGEDITSRLVDDNNFTDPYFVQVWMRRLHVGAALAVGAMLAFMVVRSFIRQQGLRIVFIAVFLGFLGLGAWAGFTADWEAARLWSDTVGTKNRAVLAVGEGAVLPAELGRVRLHLSVVPVALSMVAILSLLHYRRR